MYAQKEYKLCLSVDFNNSHVSVVETNTYVPLNKYISTLSKT